MTDVYSQRYYRKNKAKILAKQKTAAARERARRRYRTTYSKKRKSPEYRLRRSCQLRGITVDQFWAVFQLQGGACGVCRVTLDPYSQKTCKDHDHTTGVFRGLLCSTCNTALGHLERIGFDTCAFQAYVTEPPAGGAL